MWTWYSSNPRVSFKPVRLHAAILALAALFLAGPAGAQPLRQVLVELRIEAGSTLDLSRLTAPDVVQAAEQELAQLARQKFLYLDWVPHSGNAVPGAPVWLLQISDRQNTDGPDRGCDPPQVLAIFQAKRGNDIAWRYPELEFSALCDPFAAGMTAAEFVARVRELASHVVEDADAMQNLEDRFLSNIVLSKALSPDSVAQKLYLPLRGLKAQVDSEIEVRFQNKIANRLMAHPGDVDGNGTQLLLESFRCGDPISFAIPSPNALPQAWHPLLPALLSNCLDPWVYMKIYKPNPLEVDAGVVTEFDEGDGL